MMGNRIRELRKERKLTLKQVASALGDGTSFTTIAKLEKGEIALTNQWARKISEVLKVSVVELIEDDFGDYQTILPVVSLRSRNASPLESPIGYEDVVGFSPHSFIVLTSELPGVDQLTLSFPRAVVDPEWDHLRAGRLYLLRDDQGEYHARVFLEDHARYEPRSSDPTLPTFTVGKDEPKVVGQIVQGVGPLRISVKR